MKSGSQDSAQAIQRVRVGMTGLALVVVLIGIASAIYSSANRERPVNAIGASNVAVVADIADSANTAAPKSEPLAEIGLAPGVTAADTANTTAQPTGSHQ